MSSKSNKEFYTTFELVKEPWFPIKSTVTLKILIEQGEIEAVDISTSPKLKRYRISRKSAMEFIERRKGRKK